MYDRLRIASISFHPLMSTMQAPITGFDNVNHLDLNSKPTKDFEQNEVLVAPTTYEETVVEPPAPNHSYRTWSTMGKLPN